jgi:ABC-type antimicrobial peptide transport system permease subunit
VRALEFYLGQAFANLKHHPQRTVFVLFSIAFGVAAVVSLRSLGLMVGDALASDLQADNRADVVLRPPPLAEGFAAEEVDRTLAEKRDDLGGTTFSAEGLERIETWAAENGFETLRAVRNQQPLALYRDADGDADATVTGMAFFIEPEAYPFYGTLSFVAPESASIEEALARSQDVVVSDRLAASMEIGVGDRIRVRGPDPFDVTAVLDTASEARLREMEAVLLPYVLLSYVKAEEIGLRADTVYLKIPPASDVEQVVSALRERFRGIRLTSTEDLREQNAKLSEKLTQLITTMGLLSLLIGGIGIVNTMLVVVGRRTLEIGVLKTIGLQGHRITTMFLVEALVLGLLGSLLGLALGLGMIAALQGVAERVVTHALAFRIYPEPMLMGLVTGILVTLVFGFLPTLAAGRVRPNVVLQPDRASIPKVGTPLALAVVAALTGVMGLLVGRILSSTMAGMAVAYGTMIALGVATLLLWGFVRLLGKLPAPRSPYWRMSQRGLTSHPGRTASTLLALVVGMFGLSAILLMTESLLNVIDDALENQLGGDLIVATRGRDVDLRVEERLAELDGVKNVQHALVYEVAVVAINDDRDVQALKQAAYAVGAAAAEQDAEGEAVEASEETAEGGGGNPEFDLPRYRLDSFFGRLDVARPADAEQEELSIGRGAPLSPGGSGEVVLRHTFSGEWLGLEVGDTLTLRFGGEGGVERTVRIAGLGEKPPEREFDVTINVGEKTTVLASDDVIPSSAVPTNRPYIVDLEEDQIEAAVRSLSELPGVFVLKAAFLNQLLTALFQKLTALPLIVAILALIASGVIIANSVALAVQERRRQIGIMKAIGLRSSQVLRMLLLESGAVGLIGGLLGTGLGAVGIVWMGVFSASPQSFPWLTLLLLVLLAVAIAVVAAATTAVGAAREKPLVVLRYE